jgi:hypothetical protein
VGPPRAPRSLAINRGLYAICAAEFGCNFIEPRFVTCDQNHGMAVRGKLAGKLKADAG